MCIPLKRSVAHRIQCGACTDPESALPIFVDGTHHLIDQSFLRSEMSKFSVLELKQATIKFTANPQAAITGLAKAEQQIVNAVGRVIVNNGLAVRQRVEAAAPRRGPERSPAVLED